MSFNRCYIKASARQQLDLRTHPPIITTVKSNHPHINQPITLTAKIENVDQVASVEFCYHLDEAINEFCIPMSDDGLGIDDTLNDGIYSGRSTNIQSSGVINYFVRAKDSNGSVAISPSCDYHKIYATADDLTLVINEIMASNEESNAGESGDYDDWIEIHNYRNTPTYLRDKYISDKDSKPDKWPLPNILLD